MNNQINETLAGIFTIDKSKIKILLSRKKNEPYKGYWVLPGNILSNNETLEDNILSFVTESLGLPNIYIEQCHTFSSLDRSEERVIATTYVGLIDNITLYLKKESRDNIELDWFDINEIPKMGYDHEVITNDLISYLKKRIINSNILKLLFPSDFTLPELQKVYEQVLDIKIDRRNFRKKLINLGYIEYTGDINEGYTGRPAKLYRFKEDLEERNLF